METNNKFKAGDKVVRTAEYVALEDGGFMQKGNIYIVKALLNDGELLLEGSDIEYSCYYFELAQPQFKNMKGMFSNMKFRVNSPEHSKEIQEALFEMGYKWNGHYKQSVLEYSGFRYIYTESDGMILHGDWEPTFNQDTRDEFAVETTKSYKLIPVETVKEAPKEIITIDGKTYDKEAVLKRLAELETIES